MHRLLIPALALVALAGPATAGDTRYLAFDASDRITQALTRGVTLEAERSLFGAIRVRRIISTTARGSAEIRRGGPDAVRAALPAGSTEASVYTIAPEGNGAALGRALCPSAEQTWLVLGRVRLGRPLTAQAVGRWPDGGYRHCVTLSYVWRGEWTQPPTTRAEDDPATDAR